MEKLIVGNLKMNLLTAAERDRYLQSVKHEADKRTFHNARMVLCPPSMHVDFFSRELEDVQVSVGAQNTFWEDRGSFTGEISSAMLKNFGAEYVIVGHSERRKYFSETNEIVHAKIMAALYNDLHVICCIGEKKEERDTGVANEIIVSQIGNSLADIPVSKIHKVSIAYEPVWAVGSDLVPTSDEILAVKIIIKRVLTQMYAASSAEKIRILYGGSVKAKTARQVCVEPGMDGVLVGRESLIPLELFNIADIIDKEEHKK